MNLTLKQSQALTDLINAAKEAGRADQKWRSGTLSTEAAGDADEEVERCRRKFLDALTEKA